MRSVIYSMGVSLDGYIAGPDGSIDWAPPDEEVFDLAADEVRKAGVYVLGRRLYETMLYWERVEQSPAHDHSTTAFAALWRGLPKVVFSTTLTQVEGNARLATADLADEIAHLRAQPDPGEIAIGGATLAAQAAAEGLIDEYRPRVCPVLLGGGVPFFPREQRRAALVHVESRSLACGVIHQRYRVLR